MPDFLLEIGCEEIPARMIDAASQELRERVGALLSRERLSAAKITLFRYAATIGSDGSWHLRRTTGRHRASNRAVRECRIQGWSAHARGPCLCQKGRSRRITTGEDHNCEGRIPGGEGHQERAAARPKFSRRLLPKELSSIYWPKSMYWRKPHERFVRPVRWLVAMLDGETIPLEFDGIWAGKTSRGHRMLSQGDVTIPRAGSRLCRRAARGQGSGPCGT